MWLKQTSRTYKIKRPSIFLPSMFVENDDPMRESGSSWKCPTLDLPFRPKPRNYKMSNVRRVTCWFSLAMISMKFIFSNNAIQRCVSVPLLVFACSVGLITMCFALLLFAFVHPISALSWPRTVHVSHKKHTFSCASLSLARSFEPYIWIVLPRDVFAQNISDSVYLCIVLELGTVKRMCL